MHKDGDSLVLFVLNVDLLGDQVEGWELAGLGISVRLKIEHIGLFVLISTDEKNLRNFVVHSLSRNTRSRKLFWRCFKGLEFGVLSLDDGHLETLLDDHGILEWENKILEFRELDDVLRQDVTILLHDALILIFVIFPQFFEVKDLLSFVHGLVGQNILIVMAPLVFFKIYFSHWCTIRKMERVKYGVFDKEMQLHVTTWIQTSRVHDLWNSLIVKLLVHLIELEEVAQWQERGELGHGILIFG